MTQSIYSLRYQHLRKLLIEARKSQKISQTTLANSLGCVQTFVSKYERGERRLDVVEFLDVTRALGVDPHQIISEMQRKGQNQKAES
jgi:transcriptional regulator with XRE-family HTH domain